MEVTSDGVECTVLWRLEPKWTFPEYIIIEYCDLECKTIKASGGTSKANFPLEFGVPVNMTLTAVYSANDVELVERSSPTLSEYSPMGRPGRVKGLKMVEEVGNSLKIEWEPPVHPRGPVTHYIFEIFDAEYAPFRKTT